MKIALAQLNYIIGDFRGNSVKIIDSIRKARAEGADIVVFSELSVCGYPPLDLLEHKDFIEKCQRTVASVARECHGIAAVIGTPALNNSPQGKNIFNSACFLAEGKVLATVNKTLLPTYDIFDEYRYFEQNSTFKVIEYKGHGIALTICEDLWYNQPILTGFGKNRLYSVCPMDELAKHDPDLIINIAASPFSYRHDEIKSNILIENARKYKLPVIYVNQTGAQTELIFDGGSMVIDSKGTIVRRLKFFEEDVAVVDTGNLIQEDNPVTISPKNNIAAIHDALVTGIRDYLGKSGFSTAVLGLSGGIDSAVCLVLACRALGPSNMKAVLLPSMYSSEHSVKDAVRLAENLGVEYFTIPISDIYYRFLDALKPVFKDLPYNVTEENIQARIRGNLLMAYSNKFGNILLNTSNKSEAAVGYGTLYGDMSGGLSVLGDIYKTDVYRLAEYLNRDAEVIPLNTITKPPSAELRPDQKDSDSLPEYPVLDKILYSYIEFKKTAEEIIADTGINRDTVLKTVRLVNQNEYKRFQAPPILRVSPKAFGFGRRMPLVARYQ